MFLKKLVQCILIFCFYFLIEQPNFLVFTWCGEFGDRVAHPGSKSCKRRFCHQYPGAHVPHSSKIFIFMKKEHSTGSLLDKYMKQNGYICDHTK
jgi:hypothetical protein